MIIQNINGQQQKPKPTSDIDLQMLTTEPHISSPYMSENIKNKYRAYRYVLDEQGNVLTDEQGNPQIEVINDYWSGIDVYTQDVRLGNIGRDETFYVRTYLDLSSDINVCLPKMFNQSSFICLQRATNVLETSQSKDGFLRKLYNTFFQHQKQTIDEVPKERNFLGFKKKQQGGM